MVIHPTLTPCTTEQPAPVSTYTVTLGFTSLAQSLASLAGALTSVNMRVLPKPVLPCNWPGKPEGVADAAAVERAFVRTESDRSASKHPSCLLTQGLPSAQRGGTQSAVVRVCSLNGPNVSHQIPCSAGT